MSATKVFELYGYPVDSWSAEAQENLSRCNCPFMNAECDGGGNRFSSGITLTATHPLKCYFPDKLQVQAGVCSLQLHSGEQPWVVCPRRLLNYRTGAEKNHQDDVKRILCEKSGLIRGHRYSVWSEVKMKCRVADGKKEGLFDYTFDYVITGREHKPLSEIATLLGVSHSEALEILVKNGFTTCRKNGRTYCDDFPTLPLVIVEVMTSSTSGGNKRNRTQVAQLFEDTVLKLGGADIVPGGPGVNYRQVWARMVSQLLVKSQIGKAWGGVTFWVLQDLLAEYISTTTALTFSDFIAEHSDEVNIVAGGYGEEIDPAKRRGALATIGEVNFYAGKVAPDKASDKTFSDIIKLGCTPPREELLRKLLSKEPCAVFVF